MKIDSRFFFRNNFGLLQGSCVVSDIFRSIQLFCCRCDADSHSDNDAARRLKYRALQTLNCWWNGYQNGSISWQCTTGDWPSLTDWLTDRGGEWSEVDEMNGWQTWWRCTALVQAGRTVRICKLWALQKMVPMGGQLQRLPASQTRAVRRLDGVDGITMKTGSQGNAAARWAARLYLANSPVRSYLQQCPIHLHRYFCRFIFVVQTRFCKGRRPKSDAKTGSDITDSKSKIMLAHCLCFCYRH